MPAETVEWIIGRALTDLAYRQRLLGSPDEALAGYVIDRSACPASSWIALAGAPRIARCEQNADLRQFLARHDARNTRYAICRVSGWPSSSLGSTFSLTLLEE